VSTNLRERDTVSGKKGARQRPSAVEQILARTQSGRDMVQDFVPLATAWNGSSASNTSKSAAVLPSPPTPIPSLTKGDMLYSNDGEFKGDRRIQRGHEFKGDMLYSKGLKREARLS